MTDISATIPCYFHICQSALYISGLSLFDHFDDGKLLQFTKFQLVEILSRTLLQRDCQNQRKFQILNGHQHQRKFLNLTRYQRHRKFQNLTRYQRHRKFLNLRWHQREREYRDLSRIQRQRKFQNLNWHQRQQIQKRN